MRAAVSWLAQVECQGDIYTDGACFPSPVSELAVAGWGAVVMREDGRIAGTVSAPVWAPVSQTSGAAEVHAFGGIVQLLSGAATVCSDYFALAYFGGKSL